MEHIGGDIKRKKRTLDKPRYTVVLHEVRERLDLSINNYVVLDSIHKLSHTNEQYPYCTMSKDEMAKFLKLHRATVFRAINEGIRQGLIERTPEHFLRTTRKWVELVEIYSLKKG